MYKYLLVIAAIAASLFFFSSCNKDNGDFDVEEWKTSNLEFLNENAKIESVVVTNSGLQYQVISEGKENGKSPTANDFVRCNYKGMFINGQIFDSTYLDGNPALFKLSNVIKGWVEGLQYMKEGDRFRFVIPYDLGYGASGYATIPPFSTLIFDVELLDVL